MTRLSSLSLTKSSTAELGASTLRELAMDEASDGNNPTRLAWRIRLLIAGCWAFAICHLMIIFFHVAPINPISLRLDDTIDHYIGPFFQQNWQLFAPDPISVENGMLVRARIATANDVRVTEYIDVTSPAIETIHSTRLFPPRRTRLMTTVTQLSAYRDPLAERLRERLSYEEPSYDSTINNTHQTGYLVLTPGEQRTHALADHMLRNLAVKAATAKWGNQVTQVQVRFVTHRFPSYSERRSGENIGEISVQDSEWINAYDDTLP